MKTKELKTLINIGAVGSFVVSIIMLFAERTLPSGRPLTTDIILALFGGFLVFGLVVLAASMGYSESLKFEKKYEVFKKGLSDVLRSKGLKVESDGYYITIIDPTTGRQFRFVPRNMTIIYKRLSRQKGDYEKEKI